MVVIDVLRATTSICVAFRTGVSKILPVASPEECRMFKDFDFVIAAERNAVKVEGFDMGNSPFEFENPLLAGKNIAFTTTNGTKAIKLSKENGAASVVIASFLNIDFLCEWLLMQDYDVVLLCAGWKDKVNLEDTLLAGAIIQRLEPEHRSDCDALLLARSFYETHRNDIEGIVRRSSHARRFSLLHLKTDDVAYCLQHNTAHVLPIMQGEYLQNLSSDNGMSLGAGNTR